MQFFKMKQFGGKFDELVRGFVFQPALFVAIYALFFGQNLFCVKNLRFCNSAKDCKEVATVYALGRQQHILHQQCNNMSGSSDHSFSFMWKMLPQRWLNGAGGPRLGKCNRRKSFFDSVLKMSTQINPFRSDQKERLHFQGNYQRGSCQVNVKSSFGRLYMVN